jgi:chromosome partitioning protein
MVISVATQKGGVGKTTTTISLAAGLGRVDKRILVVDIDFQANASKVLLPEFQKIRPEDTIYRTIINREPLPIHPTSIPNVDIVPSHILLADTDIKLTTAKDHREERLHKELAGVQSSYDHVLIDCPPSLNWLVLNALTASDRLLIVVEPGYFELDSLVQISKTVEEVREYFNPQLELLGILFTKSDPTVNSRTSLKILRQTYTEQVLDTVIPRNTDIRDATMNRQDIFAYAPHSKSAQAYKRLIEELAL